MRIFVYISAPQFLINESILVCVGLQDVPSLPSSRFLQTSSSSSNLASTLSSYPATSSTNLHQNYPVQRGHTSDKPLNRAQKTLSMHGIPSMPAHHSQNRYGTLGLNYSVLFTLLYTLPKKIGMYTLLYSFHCAVQFILSCT